MVSDAAGADAWQETISDTNFLDQVLYCANNLQIKEIVESTYLYHELIF